MGGSSSKTDELKSNAADTQGTTNANDSQISEKQIDVPKEYHRFIIGTKGATIKDIHEQSGAKIQMPAAEEQSNKVTLVGTSTQIKKATALIKDVMSQHEKEVKEAKARAEYDLEKDTQETEVAYKKFQADVDRHAQLRSKYFEESKAAFERGDKALAKDLSEKGKKETQLMEEAQKKASRAIFKKK